MTNQTPTTQQLKDAYYAGASDDNTYDILLESAKTYTTETITEETDIDFDDKIIDAYVAGFCGHTVPYINKLN